jgi:hypothetical protein
MKIAHINNTSGVASELSQQQKSDGHESEVFVFNKLTHRQFGGNKFNYYWFPSRFKFFKKIKEFNIWHYHYPYGSLKSSLEKRKGERRLLKHYHGDDIRGSTDLDFCLVSTPDLLKYTPNGKWLPNPLNMELMKSVSVKKQHRTNNTPVRVGYYPKRYESNMHSRELMIKKSVLNELHLLKKCEIVPIINVPHDQAIQEIARCDIFVGRILPNVGWIGKMDLEAMALGNAVIAHVSDELYYKFRPPVYRTTEKTLKEDLQSLIEDPKRRLELINLSSAYVNENHSVQYVNSLLYKYYELLT